jgi:hypothetical protein
MGADGRAVKRVSKILKPEFVDLVLRPSAGGSVDLLVAGLPSDGDHIFTEDELNVTEPTPAAQKPPESPAPAATVDPAVLSKLVTEAIAPAIEAATAPLRTELSEARSRSLLETKLAGVDFQPKVKDQIRAEMPKIFTEAEVDAKFASVRTLLDVFGAKAPGRESLRVVAGSTEYDKLSDQITESLFHTKTERGSDGKITGYKLLPEGIARDSSPKRWYTELTGDHDMTGKVGQGRLTESLTTTTFAEIMGDSITRAMLANYRQLGLDTWRQFVRVNRVNDFRTQRRQRMGGYGNLPAVNQGAPYLSMTTPGDEEATYAPSKRGGTEDLTIEAIANDDLNALREIPRRMSRAAAQTLHEFIYDFFATAAGVGITMTYDATALFHANHTNTSTVALSQAELTARRNAMLKQTDMSNSKRLGIRPRFLLVPIDLEQLAYELTESDKKPAGNNNEPNFTRRFGLNTIVVEYWTDATNWYLVADPADSPTIEVGFFNGQEEPELLIQDQPTNGNVFAADKITYKIRHIYGGTVVDHRAFQGNIVAG